MDENSKNIVIIMYQYSVVIKGVERKLKELGYNVEILKSDFDTIKDYAQNTKLFILYLPKYQSNDKEQVRVVGLIFDNVWASGKKMLVVGDKEFYHDLLQNYPNLPVLESYEWMNRPIDMNVFEDTVQKLTAEEKTTENKDTKKRVLIIDDDPSYAGMIRTWLKEYFKVDIVTAGMQAITFLLKNKVDCILLDYEMPVVDGPQVLQMLRQDPETKNIPVIFLTGVGTAEGVKRVMELKPDGYILKSTPREKILGYLADKLKLN